MKAPAQRQIQDLQENFQDRSQKSQPQYFLSQQEEQIPSPSVEIRRKPHEEQSEQQQQPRLGVQQKESRLNLARYQPY
jgi:hypothetical protein